MTQPVRTRREPPPWRHATVVAVEARSPRLVRLTLAGPELNGFDPGLPASSVRLLVPDHPDRRSGSGGQRAPMTLPTWNGNEFLRADGSRPPIRTLTPRRVDGSPNELAVEVVLHGEGPLSSWAAEEPVGDPTAISGPGRGYSIDPDATAFVLAGDESAIPAISELLGALATDAPGATVEVIVEAVEPIPRVDLAPHPRVAVDWVARRPTEPPGDAMGAAIRDLELHPDTRLWVAGEAAGVHRIRRYLFEDRGLPRVHAVVRGYWKAGREQGSAVSD